MLALLRNPKGGVGLWLDGLGVTSQEQEFKLSPVWDREEIVQIISKGSKTFKPGCATERIWEVKVNNCFSKIQPVGQKYRDKSILAS